jgi:hypothetical protein
MIMIKRMSLLDNDLVFLSLLALQIGKKKKKEDTVRNEDEDGVENIFHSLRNKRVVEKCFYVLLSS